MKRKNLKNAIEKRLPIYVKSNHQVRDIQKLCFDMSVPWIGSGFSYKNYKSFFIRQSNLNGYCMMIDGDSAYTYIADMDMFEITKLVDDPSI